MYHSYRIVPCRVVLCRVVPCRAVSCRAKMNKVANCLKSVSLHDASWKL